MALGSPTGSPSTGPGYLPSYLMGEPNVMAAPRNNTFSPTKGRSLAFGGKCITLLTLCVSKSIYLLVSMFTFHSIVTNIAHVAEQRVQSFSFTAESALRCRQSTNIANTELRKCLTNNAHPKRIGAADPKPLRFIACRTKYCRRSIVQSKIAGPEAIKSIDGNEPIDL